jgi:hypothetical protein
MPTWPRCAATPPTASPEWPASATRPRRRCSAGSATWPGSSEDPDADLGPGPRRKIKDAVDYLDVAPRVVAVARDLDLGAPDLTLPLTPEDPEALTKLSERWGLDSPAARLVETLTGLRG